MESVLSVTDIQLNDRPAEGTRSDAALDQLELTVELGQTRLALADVQRLRPGALISLDEFLNDPVTLFAGSRLIGRGELLLIEDKLGVRITELYPTATS